MRKLYKIVKNAEDGEENGTTSFGALAIAEAHFKR